MKDILNMTEEQLNIECAKFMGMKIEYVYEKHVHMVRVNNNCYEVPEYSQDLNLIYEVEEKIINDLLLEYEYFIELENLNICNHIYHASALDRLKAVLLTIQEGE